MGDWVYAEDSHRVELHSSGADHTVIVDGRKLSCVTELSLVMMPGEPVEVVLTLLPDELVVAGDMDVLKDVICLDTLEDGGLEETAS